MGNITVGVLHPGEMGSVVGQIVRAIGAQAFWASEGRSQATRTRAQAAGLGDVRTLATLVGRCRMILSVCPPHAAMDLARQVAAHRFAGVYVDANAVSPKTARAIGSLVEEAGASFVDGGIVGPPPRTSGTTRLYLSGKQAGPIAALFNAGPMEAIILDASRSRLSPQGGLRGLHEGNGGSAHGHSRVGHQAGRGRCSAEGMGALASPPSSPSRCCDPWERPEGVALRR